MHRRVLSCFALFASLSACPQETKGEMGTPGQTGPVGPAGTKGDPGATGPTGPVGPPGPDGAAGANGMVIIQTDDGGLIQVDGGIVIVRGPQGPQGSQGPVGPTGTAGQVVVVSTVDGGTVVVDGGVAVIAGPPGPPGLNALFGENAALFAGFTAVTTTGLVGGRHVMHARCDAEFPGSHMCHFAEYMLSNPHLPIPVVGAWIDPSDGPVAQFSANSALGLMPFSRESGRYVGGAGATCKNWTSSYSSDESGPALTSWPHAPVDCRIARSIACCSSPYREQFIGATSQPTTGQAGGPEKMNAKCHAEYPGSHLCTFAELQRATPKTAPAALMWVQPTTNVTVASANNPPSYSSTNFPTCNAWRSTVGVGTAWIPALPSQIEPAACDQPAPLGCCR
jgi:hypothetical protein